MPYSSYSDGWGESVYFNSLGTKLNFKQSHLSGYTYANIKTDKGEIIQGEGFFGRKPEGFNPSKIGQNVARKLLNRQKTAEVKSGSYNVIFTGEMVSQLLSGLGYHISLKKIDEKTSLFDLNDLNGTSDKTKFSPLFNLVDKPLDETLPGARHCDDDGFATKNQSFFEKGRLVQFMSNQDLAEKYKLNNTANCYKSGIEKSILAHNFVMSKGDTTEVQMNRLFIDCLVIDDIQGIHAGYKESTLDFSLPASAFVMKNGEPQGYAQQFLISGNVLELLKNIVAVADHYPEAVSSFYCPSIGVENVRIAAK